MAIFKRSLPQKQPKNPEQQGTNETLGKTTNGGEASTIKSWLPIRLQWTN